MAFKIKRNDTSRVATDTLTVDGSPIVLTGATIKLIIQKPNAAVVRATATITDDVAGQVSYQFTASDTDTTGQMLLEWEITFPNGDVLTVPDNYIKVNVVADLG